MKKSVILFLLCTLVSTQLFAGVKYSINEAWRFQLTTNNEAHKKDFNDKAWQVVTIPHTWNDQDAMDETPGYFRGEGWYRKNTFIGNQAKDKVVYLYFEGANQVTDVYVNEHFVGQHKGGYTRFSFDITPYIQTDANNLIAIKVDNSHNELIPPLDADFTFFGGIYRDVYLQIENQVHLSLSDQSSEGVYITTPQVSKEKAEVMVKSLINNWDKDKRKITIEQFILSPNGEQIAKSSKKINLPSKAENVPHIENFHITNPELWSTQTPNRYTLRTLIRDSKSNQLLDESIENFGLRWFTIDAEKGFFLNGEHIKLMGTSRHQCFKDMGIALEDELHIRDVYLLKNMGGNYLRIAHYPQDPLILDLCDKLGILTSVEIPVINAVTEKEEYLKNSIDMMDEMMKQNFNHPSLVIWTYMNEIMLRPPYKAKTEEYKAYCKEVNRQATAIEKHIRTLDPYRYTQIPYHAGFSSYEDAELSSIPMTIGLNLYMGWYSPGIENIERVILNFKERNPNIPLFVSEYGADVDTRIHSEYPERFDFSVEFGDRFHEHYLKTFLKHDFIVGTNIWNLNDFHSESRTDAVPHINCKGITGLDRTPKNTYYLYKAHLTTDPFVKIASADWKYRAGTEETNKKQTVKVYTNQKEVNLYHNGVLFETLPVVDGIAQTTVSFVNGMNQLKAEANFVSDVTEIEYRLIPNQIGQEFEELNVLLGTQRSFEDKTFKTAWIPEKEYEKGSWGYVGGKTFRAGKLPAADIDIQNTEKDPIFQTQRVNIEGFRADVPNGRYYIYLYWADLNRLENKEALVYNLGSDSSYQNAQPRVFDVSINNQMVLDQYDIPSEVGVGRAIIKKFEIHTMDNEGIKINFTPIKGETILNAIRIVKID